MNNLYTINEDGEVRFNVKFMFDRNNFANLCTYYQRKNKNATVQDIQEAIRNQFDDLYSQLMKDMHNGLDIDEDYDKEVEYLRGEDGRPL